MAVVEFLLEVHVFVQHTLHGVGVHIDGYCAFMDSEWIVSRILGHGRRFVVIHCGVSTAGEKCCEPNERNKKVWFRPTHFDVTQASLQEASVLAKRTISTVLCP